MKHLCEKLMGLERADVTGLALWLVMVRFLETCSAPSSVRKVVAAQGAKGLSD